MNKRSLDDREILDVRSSPVNRHCAAFVEVPCVIHARSSATLCLCMQHGISLAFAQILCSVCEALVHLHSQAPPIAHRDIKVRLPRARVGMSLVNGYRCSVTLGI
jgi:hypothetical protein